jgi:hypothetical protein
VSAKQLRKKVAKEETTVAQALGGRRTFNSGAGSEKGDGRVTPTYQTVDGLPQEVGPSFRIENKITSKPYYVLTAADWEKLVKAAAPLGETPLFTMRLTGTLGIPLRLVALELGYAQSLFFVRNDRPPDQRGVSSYRIREETFRRALDETESYVPSSALPVPHLRFRITRMRDNDLVVTSWDWFLRLTV